MVQLKEKIRDRYEKDKFNLSRKNLLLVLVCAAVNILGRVLAQHFSLPIWFDNVGSFYAASALGPFAGATAGAIMTLVVTIWDHTAIWFLPVSVIIGYVVGRTINKINRTSYDYCLATVRATFFPVTLSTIINMFIYGGYTGNVWGDALEEMILDRTGLHLMIVVAFIAELFVDFPDKVVSTVFLVGTRHVIKRGKKIFGGKKKSKIANGKPGSGSKTKQKETSGKDSGKKGKAGKEKRGKQNAVMAFGALLLAGWVILAQEGTALFTSAAFSKLENAAYLARCTETNYRFRDGLLSSQISALAQTKDGYIWAGGDSGLYRYDGQRFEYFNPENEIASVSALYGDSMGRLWIGSNDDGLMSYNPVTGSLTQYDMAWSALSASIYAVTQDKLGNIYVGTDSYLVNISSAGIVGVYYANEELIGTRSMSASPNGYIAGVTEDGVLFLLKGEKVVQTLESGDDKGQFYTCCWGDDNELLVTCKSPEYVVYRFTDGELKQMIHGSYSGYDRIEKIIHSNVSGNYVCIAGDRQLLFNSTYELSALHSRYGGAGYTDVIMDDQANVWLASESEGVTKSGHGQFCDYSRMTDLELDNNTCIYPNEKYLFIGKTDGLVVLDRLTGEVLNKPYLSQIDGKHILNMAGNEAGDVYLCIEDEDRLTKISAADEISYLQGFGLEEGEYFLCATVLTDGTLVAGTQHRAVFYRNDIAEQVVGPAEGLTTSKINHIAQGSPGRVLVATADSGVVVLEKGGVYKILNISNGLTNENVKAIRKFKDGYFYLTSNAIFYDDREDVYRLDQFPYSNNYDICVMDNGECYVISSVGIHIVNGDDLVANEPGYHYILINSDSGLENTPLENAHHSDYDNTLYFCGREGPYSLDISEHYQYSEDTPILLEEIKTDQDPVKPDSKGVFQIDGSVENLEIRPVILDYSASNLYLHISLDGPTQMEEYASQLDYTALELSHPKSGNYTVTVEILDELTREVLRTAEFSMTKAPLFYEQQFFKMYLYSVLVAFVFFLSWTVAKLGSISTINKQYEEIRIAKDEAERANRAKTRFLAQMSHEIRTPINSVLGMDEMILRESREKNVQEYASDIYNAGRTLLSLVNEILDFSKIESESMELVEVEYEIASLIHDLYNMVNHRADAKNLKLVMEVDPEIPYMLYGDDVRVKQCITNLLTNAVKYTQEGTVWFRISATTGGDYATLHVEVEDTGIGIKKENIPHLFDAYKRFDKHKNHYIEGTGLGLGIVTSLLKLMNSELKVESEYGKGSKFSFDVVQKIVNHEPIGDFNARVSESTDATVKLSNGFIAPDCTVMVVDDSTMNLRVFRSLLKITQIKVREANGGAESIKFAKDEKFDMIFMDHMMPEIDGIAAFHRIREDVDSLNRETPIYVLTANAVAGAKEKYLDEGFSGFLSKPILFEKLLDALHQYLPADKQFPLPEDAEQPMEGGNPLPDNLPMVEGLDWEVAWLRLPAMDLLKGGLADFYELLPAQSRKLSGQYDDLLASGSDEAYDAYRIQVHAMKGSANTLGLFPLGGMAKVLEFAARDHQLERIVSLHPTFIEEWDSYKEKLRGVFDLGTADAAEKEQAEDWMLETFLTSLSSAMADMDVDTADEILAKMKGYHFSDTVDARIPDLAAAVTALDEDAVNELIRSMLA
ncbi:MAG: response regulator [Lachnospiraceae bacterium]|nr:response regulator [Lachnospiraceae bacterium]